MLNTIEDSALSFKTLPRNTVEKMLIAEDITKFEGKLTFESSFEDFNFKRINKLFWVLSCIWPQLNSDFH